MAYVVSATWTAQPGQEDVVLDAIEKLTPPSRAEEGNVFYQAYQDPAEPVGLPPVRDLRRRGGVRRPRRVGPLQEFALEQAIPVLAKRERAFYETIG